MVVGGEREGGGGGGDQQLNSTYVYYADMWIYINIDIIYYIFILHQAYVAFKSVWLHTIVELWLLQILLKLVHTSGIFFKNSLQSGNLTIALKYQGNIREFEYIRGKSGKVFCRINKTTDKQMSWNSTLSLNANIYLNINLSIN